MNVDTAEFAALRERVDACADVLLKAYLAEALTPPPGLSDVNCEAARYQAAASRPAGHRAAACGSCGEVTGDQ